MKNCRNCRYHYAPKPRAYGICNAFRTPAPGAASTCLDYRFGWRKWWRRYEAKTCHILGCLALLSTLSLSILPPGFEFMTVVAFVLVILTLVARIYQEENFWE